MVLKEFSCFSRERFEPRQSKICTKKKKKKKKKKEKYNFKKKKKKKKKKRKKNTIFKSSEHFLEKITTFFKQRVSIMLYYFSS